MKVNYGTKVNRCNNFEPGEMKMNYFYDDNSKFYFNILSNCFNAQTIIVGDSKKIIKHLYFPYYFSKIIPLKKEYLLGIIQN